MAWGERKEGKQLFFFSLDNPSFSAALATTSLIDSGYPSSTFHHPLSFFCFFLLVNVNFSSFTAHINCLCQTLNSLSSRSSPPEVSGGKNAQNYTFRRVNELSPRLRTLLTGMETPASVKHICLRKGKNDMFTDWRKGSSGTFSKESLTLCRRSLVRRVWWVEVGGCSGYREPQEQWERADKRQTARLSLRQADAIDRTSSLHQ